MSSKFNKGFKGSDRQDGAPGTTAIQATKGRQHVQDRFFQRKLNEQQADTGVNTEYSITNWRSVGWSSSLHEDSGSIMYWSPSSNLGGGWSAHCAVTVPTIRLREWSGTHLTSSVSYRTGNCRGGSGAGNIYGFYGLMNRSLLFRQFGGTLDSPYGDYNTLPQWGWCAFTATANRYTIYEQAGTSRGHKDNVEIGDTLEVRVTKDGVVSYWYANTGAAYTASADFELFATSPTNILNSKSNDKDYHFVLANNANGVIGNYHSFDYKFKGEVDFNPYWFDNQLNQQMITIPTTEFGSGSSYNVDAAIPYESLDGIGNTSVRIDPAASTAYADAMWAERFITGSGLGGIYKFKMPGDPGIMPVGLICGLANHTKESAYNYYTNTVCIRPASLTTNWDDYPGFAHSLPSWYGGGAAAAQVWQLNQMPVTSGSEIAMIITGSNWGFLSTTGSGESIAPNPNNGGFAITLWKPTDGGGLPANDWISPHWHALGYSLKSDAASTIHAQKLFFGNGADGATVDEIKVGSNHIISGTI